MKTAVSVPDEVFEAAERAAKRLGLSRSQLYATALRDYVERIERESVTARLDAIYGAEPEESLLDPVIADMQLRSLEREDWD